MNDTPQNGAYMIAAYTATAVILLYYLVSLVLRARRKG